jgi:hypothetical protein
MSAHFVNKKEPPPGLSSFTKIRLGWISSRQVLLVRPGETREVVLSPLARRGEMMAVKIPLQSGHYYLVENRQPINYDRVLPDAGILILRVNPDASEGSGTVQVMDADPGSPNFSRATFKPDQKDRKTFTDRDNNIAVIATGAKGERQRVLITTPKKAR